nr:zinc finger, CCHC-type [Tanacetum cinerariifolium]
MYDVHNEVACLMLVSMTHELHRQFENYSPSETLQELSSMFEKQAGVERFDLIQTFHAFKQEEGKSVAAYVLQMKGYVAQLECFGYVLPRDLRVGLIMNGLTSDFASFVRNYNKHNMGKTIGELHALLIEVCCTHLNMVSTKKVDKTPYDLWYGKVPDLSYLKVEGFEPPHEEEAHVRRSVKTHRAPERLCLNVEEEEHSLRDLNEPYNYKAAILDPESDKWLDAMNTEMKSIKDNQV